MSEERRRGRAAGGDIASDGASQAGTRNVDRARASAAKELVQLASFVVGDEVYALDIMRIKEIITPLPITKVPKSPHFIEGVVELRGAILPIVDLRKRFELPASPLTRSSKYLIVAIQGIGERWIVGLVVDGVKEVIRVPKEELRAAPAMTANGGEPYFSGVCRHRDRIVMVVELDAILSSSERISLAGMGDGPLPSTGASSTGAALAAGGTHPGPGPHGKAG